MLLMFRVINFLGTKTQVRYIYLVGGKPTTTIHHTGEKPWVSLLIGSALSYLTSSRK
jgi:hypothetical protein